jgi:hypothetical protein
MTKHQAKIQSFAQAVKGEIITLHRSTFVLYELCAAEWTHNTKRPSNHYRFKTEATKEAWLQERFASLEKQEAEREAYKARRMAEAGAFIPGEILYDSWGWEQTNIDFYIVVKRSPSSVWLSPIGSKVEETGFMSGKAHPDTTKVGEEVIMRKINKWGGISIASHRGTLSKYEGRPLGCSWYA